MLDLLLLVAIAIAVATGLRLGFLARAASFIGLVAGIALATVTVPYALAVTGDGQPAVRLFVGLVVLAVTVTVVATLFQAFGLRLRRSVADTPLSTIDRGAGAIAGVLIVLMVVWFLIPAASVVPGSVARQVRTSAVVDAVMNLTPPPPDTVQALRNLVDTSRFPEVFADLQPAPDTGPPPDQIPIDAAVVERATASTVNVETEGCGRRFEGSGFTIQPGVVVTNAHVIAGADVVEVRLPDGPLLPATVVVLDPDRDLAVLEVDDLPQEPLERATGDVGMVGVVIGYPGGQDTPRVAPVEVRDKRTAIGRDIYGRDRTEREVLFLAAELRQGDSGSPVIDGNGRVVGVTFAISPDQPTSAFALDRTELEAVLGADRNPGFTGPCI
ncbi:MarP family serine protease [Nitriliruptor alkaliphilus]|uniref:MarP family serine protease n=1 Tax=Nitriliruptor alkaliphilus TaxID=427918 RepID=UPI000ABA3B2B|nr:MarP family serine protease [Nitriliruptor alkaliphilus]